MNDVAGENHLFVCCACGKVAQTRYGFTQVGSGRNVKYERNSSPGWDESCMLNALEVPADKLVWNEDKTRVLEVKP